MSPWRYVRAILVGGLLGLVIGGGVMAGVDPRPIEASGPNRAAVVVDTGSGPVARCISFDAPSITGTQALSLAGFSPVIRSFSGVGGAVCGLSGLGCPADGSCLTCQAPNYWAYHRAAPGASGYSYSSAGASTTSVTDGSVEAWRWGTGSAPAYRSFASVCPLEPPPPSTSTPRPQPAPGGGGGGAVGGGGTPAGGGGSAEGPAPAAPDGGGGAPASSVTTTTAPPAGDRRPAPAAGLDGGEAEAEATGDQALVSTTEDPTAASTGPTTVVVLTVVVAGLLAVGWRIRRARTLGQG